MSNHVKALMADLVGSLAYARHMPEQVAMSLERHVKAFKNGRNQAVRIPREFEFRGERPSCERSSANAPWSTQVCLSAPNELLIAAQALALGYNDRKFAHVENLRLENLLR